MKTKTNENNFSNSAAMCTVLLLGSCLLASCGDKVADTGSQAPPDLSPEEVARRHALEEAVDSGDKEYQARMRNPPTNQLRLPNFETGPGRPLPELVNFYSMDERFPSYLLCEYQVKEVSYDQSKEPEWFQTALLQIRESGPKKFPPIKWVAVIIGNRAQHKGASTFEQSFKVGAIFQATNVFDSSTDLRNLASHAELDRHPFKYDLQQATPGEQQRWVIVERHAAANGTNAVFK